jgi:hypothetical protein
MRDLFEIDFEHDMKLIEKYCKDNNVDVCNMSAMELNNLMAILIKDKYEKTFDVKRKENNKK